MIPNARLVLVLALAAGLAGCGSKSEQQPASSAPAGGEAAAPAPAETSASAATEVSPFDAGPRAGESKVNAAAAAAGEKLFTTKGCVTCHTLGKKALGPDLTGVSMRRTAEWMKNQILHPEKMVVSDPISRELRKGFSLAMTNQGLKESEAEAVIEFLKKKDHDAGITTPAK
jgi:cytochrome c551/c552